MEIRPYGRKHSEVIKTLYKEGVLQRYPEQIKRDDLETDDGIDIILTFKSMTPAKFKKYAEMILWAAHTEAQRYETERVRFAKFDVELNRTAKGRKAVGPIRSYIAAKHTDSEIMIFGEEKLGATLPEEVKSKPFLINKIEEILRIPDEPSPGIYVKKQNPYKVLRLIVSIRAGLTRKEVQDRKRQEADKMRAIIDRSFDDMTFND